MNLRFRQIGAVLAVTAFALMVWEARGRISNRGPTATSRSGSISWSLVMAILSAAW